jgi:hypothetical protein
MKLKYLHNIGDKVTVFETVDFCYLEAIIDNKKEDERTYTSTPLAIPLVGRITGAKYIPLGIYEKGYGDSNGYGYVDNYTPPWLSVTSTVFVYTVKFGLLNKDVYVLPTGILSNFNDKELPLKYCPTDDETKKRASEIMKEEMKNWPRDEKGRWLPQIKKVINNIAEKGGRSE